MRRAAILASVLLVALILSEQRLADLSGRRSADVGPALWMPVIEHRLPFRNCVFLTSTDLRNPYVLTPVADGVRFDIDGDGTLDQVSWPKERSGVAFLALDQDGDGRITGARELIGEHTVPDAGNAPNALLRLAEEGGAGRTVRLDREHPLFLRLLLWMDGNHDGISEPAELRPAREVFTAMDLGFSGYHRVDEHGNQARYRGGAYVRTAPGPNLVTSDDWRVCQRPLYEVCLTARQAG